MSKDMNSNLQEGGCSFGEFTLDVRRARLLRAGSEIKLRPKPFEVLKYLVNHPDRIVTKEELIRAVWPDAFVTDDSLVQCLREVRKALGDEKQVFIKTVPRRGYMFAADVYPADQVAAHTEYQLPSQPAPTMPIEKRSNRTRLWLSLAGVILAVVAAYLWVSLRTKAKASDSLVKSIAVLPFKSLGTSQGDDLMGLGMADTLITRLSNIREIAVRPTSAVRR